MRKRRTSMLSGGEEDLLFRVNSDLHPRQRSISMNNQASIFDGFFHIGNALQPSLGDDGTPLDIEQDMLKEIDQEIQNQGQINDNDPYGEIQFQFEPNDVMAVITNSITDRYAQVMKGNRKSSLEINKLKVIQDIRSAKRLMQRKVNDSRQQDKWLFQIGVLALMAKMYYFALDPCGIFVYLNAAFYAVLIILRFFRFRKTGKHYYLLDFCYYINFFTMVIAIFRPQNDHFFNGVYFFAVGVLTWAIPTYRNSLIFHSIDHMTSLYIHSQPGLIMTVLRWGSRENCPNYGSVSLFNSFHYVIALYFVWAVLYYLANFVVFSNRIHRKKYQILFHFYQENNKGLTGFIMNLCGGKHKPAMFMLMHMLMTTVTGVVSTIQFHFYYLNYLILFFILFLALSNGTNYYFQYFSKKYQKSLDQLIQIEKKVAEAQNLEIPHDEAHGKNSVKKQD